GPFAVNPFPSPVSKTGNLSVGQSNGSSERETYLHVDATSIPAGSTVSTLVITLHEDLKDSGGGSNQSLAKIKAVPVKEFWGDGVYAAPYSQRPARDDSFSGVEGKRAVDAATQVVTWTFDMAPIANLWTAGTQNNGVAFVPEPGTPAPAAGAPNPS